LNDKDLFLK